MSDQGSGAAGGPGEASFRQSAEEKRASETVMLNQDNLNELMAQAKEGTPAADPAPAPDPVPAATQDGESAKPNVLVIAIVAVVVIAAIIVVVLLTSSG